MLREYFSNLSLLQLPVIAMVAFLLLFLAVLWRVTRAVRRPEYARMASLPLEAAERTAPRTAGKGGR